MSLADLQNNFWYPATLGGVQQAATLGSLQGAQANNAELLAGSQAVGNVQAGVVSPQTFTYLSEALKQLYSTAGTTTQNNLWYNGLNSYSTPIDYQQLATYIEPIEPNVSNVPYDYTYTVTAHHVPMTGWITYVPAYVPGVAGAPIPVPTEEELAAQRHAQYVAAAERSEMEARREKAREKSYEFLLTVLDDEQRRTWKNARYFRVRSQHGNIYTVYDRGSMNVVRKDTMRVYCLVQDIRSIYEDSAGKTQLMPSGDKLAMQKLLLECAEDKFVAYSHSDTSHSQMGRLTGRELLA